MRATDETVLALICYGIGKPVRCSFPKDIDWESVFGHSQKQGVAAIVLDGINFCFEKGIELNLDFQTKMDWIGLVSQMEAKYAQHEKNMRTLAAWYKQHGINMMVLKGYGLSLNYPLPNHRPSGDIDIYLFGE